MGVESFGKGGEQENLQMMEGMQTTEERGSLRNTWVVGGGKKEHFQQRGSIEMPSRDIIHGEENEMTERRETKERHNKKKVKRDNLGSAHIFRLRLDHLS